MNQRNIDGIAVRLLEIFIILMGFTPTGDWDENDPSCRRDYGPHRVYTLCGRTQKEFDIEELSTLLGLYLESINKVFVNVRFHIYDIDAYKRPYGRSAYIYVSIST